MVVHAHHILGCKPVLGFVTRHHRRGVQLKQIEGVGEEGGWVTVTQNLQAGRRQGGADDLKLEEVLATLEAKSLIELIGLVFSSGVQFEDIGFGAVGDVFKLS